MGIKLFLLYVLGILCGLSLLAIVITELVRRGKLFDVTESKRTKATNAQIILVAVFVTSMLLLFTVDRKL
jgi:hypothetical protein